MPSRVAPHLHSACSARCQAASMHGAAFCLAAAAASDPLKLAEKFAGYDGKANISQVNFEVFRIIKYFADKARADQTQLWCEHIGCRAALMVAGRGVTCHQWAVSPCPHVPTSEPPLTFSGPGPNLCSSQLIWPPSPALSRGSLRKYRIKHANTGDLQIYRSTAQCRARAQIFTSCCCLCIYPGC